MDVGFSCQADYHGVVAEARASRGKGCGHRWYLDTAGTSLINTSAKGAGHSGITGSACNLDRSPCGMSRFSGQAAVIGGQIDAVGLAIKHKGRLPQEFFCADGLSECHW